ncbi:MAG: nicotinamide riboside transporter PnuC [Nocardioidaceae bacterium]
MSLLQWLLEGSWTLAGKPILVREVVGNGFGLLSALLGLRRLISAWPIGMIGNAVLFTVFVGGIFDKPQEHDLWGQAARQVFFFAVSAYGWWRWRRTQRAGGALDGGAIAPRWATAHELRQLIVVAAAFMIVFVYALRWLGSWGPVADAWILTGSILATYGMARGYVEFWWIWIAVDAVGVPLLLEAGYYPSAVLYLVYGGLCLAGYFTWSAVEKRLSETRHDDIPARTQESAHA